MAPALRQTAKAPAKDAGKASWQAQVGFYLSLATAMFAGFQWWTGQRQAKITAAVDISRRLMEDRQFIISGAKLAEDINDLRIFNPKMLPSRISLYNTCFLWST